MPRITIKKSIAAAPALVFQTVAHIEEFAKVITHIVKVEFLSQQQTGLGTRFRETRLMKGKEAATELEVTEYEANQRVRMVADSHGTIWDTVFTVTPSEHGCELEVVMDAKAYRLLPRLMNPLICGMITKAVEADMDAVRTYCERQHLAEVESGSE